MVIGVALAVASALVGSTPDSTALCQGLLPSVGEAAAQPRQISTDDLLRLRDIGQPDPGVSGPSPLAPSPDGRWLAFVVTRGDPISNRICQGLVVIDLSGKSAPRLLDTGGEAIRAENVIRSSRTPSGLPATIVPAWSPDGLQVAYLKRLNGRTQAWRVAVDGSASIPITEEPVDVEAVTWSNDGSRLIYATRPGRLTFAAAVSAEARIGYNVDARVIPANGPAPQLPADLPRQIWSMPRGGGSASPASTEDIATLGPERSLDIPSPLEARTPDGRRGGADLVGGYRYADRRIWASDSRGARLTCGAAACEGDIRGVWYDPYGGELLFLRYEGWRGEATALYRWKPGSSAPTRVLDTDAAVVGCTAIPGHLLCLRETSLTPRQIVTIDTRNGRVRSIFDPNPIFALLERPGVVRLRWRNSLGLPTWGDLVLPKGPRPSRGWPLVVVQYESRGFLRGGTGDEYPIMAIAARGMAVLSFQRPPLVASSRRDLTDAQLVATTLKDYTERRSVQDSLEKGLDFVFARGDIDRQNVGITGLSEGATTARFAMIAGTPLKAAALSTCCRYQRTDLFLGGTVVADSFRDMGYPTLADGADPFWKPLSLPEFASKLQTPLLLQVSDEEWLFSLETFMALREKDKPVELRVFPGEYHLKWQPAHRAAVYERSLDWFAFWLKGDEGAAPSVADDLHVWRAWREKVVAATPSRASAP